MGKYIWLDKELIIKMVRFTVIWREFQSLLNEIKLEKFVWHLQFNFAPSLFEWFFQQTLSS